MRNAAPPAAALKNGTAGFLPNRERTVACVVNTDNSDPHKESALEESSAGLSLLRKRAICRRESATRKNVKIAEILNTYPG